MEINYENWKIVKKLGTGSFGSVYEIEREDFGVYKAALKVITIPQFSDEINEIRNSGMSDKSISDYYSSMVEDFISEFALMNKLKGTTNIVSYEDHKIIPHEGEIGWDIYIRMELLTPLEKYLEDHLLTEQDVAHLGIDICRALERCEKLNVIHRDIKPGNIFVSDAGDFKLGDFGVARTVERAVSNLSRKGTYNYMAPEVYNGMDYGQTVDIYSLGLVMFRLLNHNRTPFLPTFPEPIKFQDQEIALLKRINGTALPYPNNEESRLGDIILKACAFDPAERFQTAAEFRLTLEAWLNTPEKKVTKKGAAPVKDAAEKSAAAISKAEKGSADKCLSGSDVLSSKTAPSKTNTKKKKNGLIIGIAAAVVVILAVVIVLLNGSSSDAPAGSETTTAAAEETTTAAPAETVIEKVMLKDYTGSSVADAQTELDENELTIIIEETDDISEEGTILEQSPAAGTSLEKGSGITFVVSKGNQLKLPDFYDHSLKSFRRNLADNLDDVEIVVSKKAVYDADVTPGRIAGISLDQPQQMNNTDSRQTESVPLKAGDIIYKHAKLVVYLCGVPIPENITELSEEEAREALSALEVNTISYYSSYVPYGRVIRITDENGNELSPGRILKKGTPVTLHVSIGPEPVYADPVAPTLPAPPDEG